MSVEWVTVSWTLLQALLNREKDLLSKVTYLQSSIQMFESAHHTFANLQQQMLLSKDALAIEYKRLQDAYAVLVMEDQRYEDLFSIDLENPNVTADHTEGLGITMDFHIDQDSGVAQ